MELGVLLARRLPVSGSHLLTKFSLLLPALLVCLSIPDPFNSHCSSISVSTFCFDFGVFNKIYFLFCCSFHFNFLSMVNSFNPFSNTSCFISWGLYHFVNHFLILMFSCPYHPTELFVIFLDVISSEVGIFF